MKILTPGLFSFLLFFSINTTKAQTVKGILTDESDNTPIAGATVKLINRPDSLHQDSSTAYTTVSNKGGAFIFTNVTPKLYRLSVESIGFGKYQITVSVKDSMITDLATIP
ncbi:MAG: carboxypeptidase-like regulatory domain-containing protein, partial [Ginsengibacter sp.]